MKGSRVAPTVKQRTRRRCPVGEQKDAGKEQEPRRRSRQWRVEAAEAYWLLKPGRRRAGHARTEKPAEGFQKMARRADAPPRSIDRGALE